LIGLLLTSATIVTTATLIYFIKAMIFTAA
jgi:hypothetical protein